MNFKRYVEASDTWVDSHYIRNTSTDTLTLPAVIYGDGTDAILTLKGNEEHIGTPSPRNPVDVNGVGERTAQLFEDRISSCNVSTDGKLIGNSSFDMLLAKVEQGVTYTTSAAITGGFFTTKPVIGSTSYDGQRMAFANATFTAPITGYLAFRVNTGDAAMINAGSIHLPYEPYGYKIPVLIGSTTTNIYIGENPLRKSLDGIAYDTLDADGTLTQRVDRDGSVLVTPVVTQITMPIFTLADGANTVSVDTTVQPSEMTMTYHGWHPVAAAYERNGGQWR